MNYEKILYTRCEQCAFNVDDKCFIGRPSSDKKIVGLCRSRIVKDINKPEETQTPESLALFVKEKLIEENSCFNVVVWFNGDLEKLSKTVSSISEENHERCGTVTIVIPSKFGHHSVKIKEIASSLKQWEVFRNLEETERGEDILCLFEDAKKKNRGWYLFIEAGDEPCFDCITTRFLGLIVDNPNNAFALIHPIHHDRYLIHSMAFLSLGATEWINNAAEFENFENCVMPLLNTSIKIGRTI